MAEYDRRLAEAGGSIPIAARRLLDEVDGETSLSPKRVSSDDVEVGNVDGKSEMLAKY
jgi:hypothetical protein